MLNEANGWQLKKTKTQQTLTHRTSQVSGRTHVTELFTWKECVTELSYECLKNEVSCFPDFQVALSYPSQELA